MMMNVYMILGIVLFLLGVIVFVSNRKHLLSMLLSLEYMVLNLFFFLLFVYLSLFDYGGAFSMVFLTSSVCEGALGLSILVSMIRTHGNDYFQSFNVLQC